MAPQINYLAVVVAAVAAFALGWIWYGPLFGKAWGSMVGVNMDIKPAGSKMAKTIILNLIGTLIMAWVLDHALIFAIAYLKMGGAQGGLMGGFFNWLGFIAPVTLGVVLWENKPWKLWFLNAGYYLVSLCVMGVILAVWM